MTTLSEQTQTHKSWLWPNHVIYKRESRELRLEHNRLVNSHTELLTLCRAPQKLSARDLKGLEATFDGLTTDVRWQHLRHNLRALAGEGVPA